MAQIEVMTGPVRRRRWSETEKRAIVAAAFAPGAIVAEVVRQADVCASQVYRWRQELSEAPNGFAELSVVPDAAMPAGPPRAAIEIEFAGVARLRMSSSVPAVLAAAVVQALSRR